MLLFRLAALAQGAVAFEVAVSTFHAVDAARSGRRITATLYLATGKLSPAPVVAFAHGFGLSADAYPLARLLAERRGFVVLLPHNFGVVPSTVDLALDQAFLLAHAVNESASNRMSPLYGRVGNHTVLAGHSLGGGSTVLAADATLAAAYPTPTAMFTVSLGTYTIPGALNSAPNIPASMPALLLTATEDCIDPPAKNSIPVFQAMRSGCVFVPSVVGGSHCQYAASSIGCATTETLCGAHPNITRESQVDRTLSIVFPFLDAVFSGAPEAWASFNASLARAVNENTMHILAHRSDSCSDLTAPPADLDSDFAVDCQLGVAHAFHGHLLIRLSIVDGIQYLRTKPSAQADEARININVTMLMHVEKAAPFSHTIAIKMKSGEYLTPSVGADNVTCASLHNVSLRMALSALNATERRAYGKLTKRLVFGQDDVWRTGLYVAASKLSVTEDDEELRIVAPRFVTSTKLPGQWGGVFYCRLVPPVAIRDWIRSQIHAGRTGHTSIVV